MEGWPLKQKYNGAPRVSSNNFGEPRYRDGKFHHSHQGTDMNHKGLGNGDRGAPIIATHEGKVSRIGYSSDGNAGGNRIEVTSADGKVKTRYMYLESFSDIKLNQVVQEGQQIGTMGNSGSSQVHLHYEIWLNGSPINPMLSANVPVDPQQLISGQMTIAYTATSPEVIVYGVKELPNPEPRPMEIIR